MKLSYLKAGLYRGEVKEYNVKTSDRTGKTYLNLNLDIDAFGQQIEVRKSYCLEPGYNFQIMKLMEEVEGIDRSGVVNFDKLYDYELMVGIYYDDHGQLVVDKIETIPEEDFEDDYVEDDFEEDDIDV